MEHYVEIQETELFSVGVELQERRALLHLQIEMKLIAIIVDRLHLNDETSLCRRPIQ